MNSKYLVRHYPLKKLYRLKHTFDLVCIKKKYYMNIPKIITCSRKTINKPIRR